MRTLIVTLIVAFLTVPAYSQDASGGKRHHNNEQKSEQQTKTKVDDKAYKSSLDQIPTQKYDPWRAAR